MKRIRRKILITVYGQFFQSPAAHQPRLQNPGSKTVHGEQYHFRTIGQSNYHLYLLMQIGNEINHGIVWPEGNVSNIDGTAQLINAGTAAVKAVDPTVVMMLHVALGGQNHESVFFIDNMIARGVHFDVIGESYYPKWHGTLSDLENNLNDLVRRYNKDVIVVEYSALKEEVNKIAFELPSGKGKGTCIWEPLSTWEKIFDADGKSNKLLLIYDELAKKFL